MTRRALLSRLAAALALPLLPAIHSFDPSALAGGFGGADDIVGAVEVLHRPEFVIASEGSADDKVISAAMEAFRAELRRRDAELDAEIVGRDANSALTTATPIS